MLRRLDLRGKGDDLRGYLPRPKVAEHRPVEEVREIIAAVRAGGDSAARDLTARYDGVDIDELRVPSEQIASAAERLPEEVVVALSTAEQAIAHFHASEARQPRHYERDGIIVECETRPVDRAGLYIPGGRAAYPSTVLMTACPAWAAGVPEIVMCVPPAQDGSVPDACLAAAQLAGVDEVYRVGGAQAIAAMAYGTETIAAVDVIAGPGNAYVATAKQEVAGVVGVPSAFAGPSEIVVVADSTTPTSVAAIDVIVQAEHGPGGLAWLVTWDEHVGEAVCKHMVELIADSPRADDITSTIAEGGYFALVDGPEQAAAVANAVAPEHLQLMNADPGEVLVGVRHAGAVFCGPWAPATLGDYIAGPSHVLPTAGTARYAGALGVEDFTKRMHVITADREAFDRVRGVVATLADVEGLPAHAASVTNR